MGGSEISWGVVMALWLAGMAVGAWSGVGSVPTARAVAADRGSLAGRARVSSRCGAQPSSEPHPVRPSPRDPPSGCGPWRSSPAQPRGSRLPDPRRPLGSAGGGRAYGFEAVGALIGGILLSIGLIHLGRRTPHAGGLGIVAAGAAWQRRSSIAAALAVVAVALVGPGRRRPRPGGVELVGPPGHAPLVARNPLSADRDFGRPARQSIYGDGRLLASYPDPWVIQPRAHLVMLLHPAPPKVFALGCVVDGSIEAMADIPIDRLTVVEEDPDLLRALPDVYGSAMEAALHDPPVSAVAADPLRALMPEGRLGSDRPSRWRPPDAAPQPDPNPRVPAGDAGSTCVPTACLVMRVGVLRHLSRWRRRQAAFCPREYGPRSVRATVRCRR